MTDRQFEAGLEAAFAESPPAEDADAFARGVMGRIAREERRRSLALALAGAGGLVVMVQTLMWTRGFPELVAGWSREALEAAQPAGAAGAYAWMAAGLLLAGVALLRGVEA